jgi:hypothetical protein
MRERLEVCIKALKTVDWASEALTTPCKATGTLVQETGTLHRVLSPLLPPESLKVMTRNMYRWQHKHQHWHCACA